MGRRRLWLLRGQRLRRVVLAPQEKSTKQALNGKPLSKQPILDTPVFAQRCKSSVERQILYPQYLQEEIKEWTAVLGLPSSPVKTLTNNPESGWTTWVYGDKFQATSAQGVTHNIQTNKSVVLEWFDLKCSGSGCYSRPASG